MAQIAQQQPVGPALETGTLSVIAARSAPHFYVIDIACNVLFATLSPDATFDELPLVVAGPGRLPVAIERNVQTILHNWLRNPDDAARIALVRPGVILRVIPLSSHDGSSTYGIFLERFKTRSGIRPAAKAYGLTPREVDVLEQIVRGYSTNDIAAHLCIAESTVQDHVKNISMKMRVRKRSEIVARVLGSLPPVA